MEITQPINPYSNDSPESDYILDEAIQFINHSISRRLWHDQIVKVKDYRAIHIKDFSLLPVMDKVVKLFIKKGWDCKWSSAYDARGPHYCFYINKKHFQ